MRKSNTESFVVLMIANKFVRVCRTYFFSFLFFPWNVAKWNSTRQFRYWYRGRRTNRFVDEFAIPLIRRVRNTEAIQSGEFSFERKTMKNSKILLSNGSTFMDSYCGPSNCPRKTYLLILVGACRPSFYPFALFSRNAYLSVRQVTAKGDLKLNGILRI